jgi:hypothetical protein
MAKRELSEIEQIMGGKMHKEEKILYEIYRRLFAAATPTGDFYELVRNATINERGEKEIPYNDYELDADEYEKIVDSTIKEFKVPTYRRSAFRIQAYLGCGPRSKMKF